MAMKYVAAYLMAVLSGNDSPSSKDVETILGSVGGEVDKDVLGAFMKSVKGKSPHELVAQGLTKLQSVPSGGGGGGGGAAAGAAAAAPEKKEEKEEEKEEEEEEDDLGFSLFD
eukprot:GHVS01088739.1.p1 GENE.GHVS01088739.1~~GHVS01088739.1.p1  ORF type:complete len:113 (+),score=52.91 GHVS01088739.1:154-492(+)